jgi:hypothetical protein
MNQITCVGEANGADEKRDDIAWMIDDSFIIS